MTLPKRFVLLEADASWQEEAHVEVRWDSCEVAAEQISIPLRVEEQALEIRSEYLEMIYEVGKTRIEGKPLTEHLKLFDNLSLWWLTPVVEKTPFLYESIYKVFKLRNLEKLYLHEGCDELIYCGSDPNLNEVLSAWCKRLGHSYRNVSLNPKDEKSTSSVWREFFDKLPGSLQVFAWLVRRWWQRFRHSEGITSDSCDKFSGGAETIVTFFPNIDLGEASHGRFHSRYWGKLHRLLDSSETKINWVWFYFFTKDIPFHRAVALKNTFNQNSENKQQFFLLEDFLDFRSFLKGLRLYLKIFFRGSRLTKIRDAFCFSGSKMNCFPILRKDWNSSIFGIMAIERIFQGVTFDSMARHLSVHKWGLYTWENQPWEQALISAWRRHRENSKIIAYEHSSVRPLDLRLFMNRETYMDSSSMPFLLPDILGINGSVGISEMQESGYPREKLAQIEALRFFNLHGKYGSERKAMKEAERTLLVVTGIIPQEADFQLQFLQETSRQGGLEKYNHILIKPHPGFALDSLLARLNPDFDYEVVAGAISNYWSRADVVYCANSSGASLEAAWLGIPLIITAAVDSMNLNPLFGFKGLNFVYGASQLTKALEQPRTIDIPNDYFFLDEKLKSWKEILGL